MSVGSPRSEKPFSVLTSYRPRRVAFLVDPADPHFEQILDAIADFGYDTWGGTYNPIIPVSQGKLAVNFWPLLQAADPDVLYSYAEIEASEVRRFDRAFVPTRMMPHRYDDENKDHTVWIQGQASIEFEILGLTKQPGLKARRVLTWSPLIGSDRFIRRNFGASRVAYALAADGYVAPTDGALMRVELCSAITRGLILSPRFISSQAPLEREFASGPMHSFEFLICYGDSGWNFIHFWNEAYRHGFPDSQIPHWVEAIWMPSEMSSRDQILPVASLIEPRLAHTPGGFPLKVRIVTYDHAEYQVQSLAELITNTFPGRVAIETTAYEPGFFPGGRILQHRPISRPEPPHHDQVRGPEFFVSPGERTTALKTEDVWIADVRIQSIEEATTTLGWWNLPRRSNVADLLHDTTASRIKEDGTLSVEVSNRTQNIQITLPGHMELFRALLSPTMRYSGTTDLRYPLIHYAPETFIALSDKGKYAQGVIALFQSLPEAGYVLEHRFWREFLNEYSSPRRSEQSLTKLRKDIGKWAGDFIQQYGADKDSAVAWFSEKMLRSLRSIPQIREAFAHQDLVNRWRDYLDNLGSQERILAELNEPPDEVLARLSKKGVVLHRCKVQCAQCGSSYWYHIDNLAAEFPCQGCREQVMLPVEPPWSYQLNDLIRTAIREHGTVPLLRTAYRLMRESKAFFRLLAGVELHEMADQDTALIGELDICYASDGRFGVAEVKTSAKDFTPNECAKIADLAKRVLPDDVLIAAVEGSDTTVESARSTIEQKLEGVAAVRAFPPSSFNR